jgi:hypothetical protein
MNTTASSNSHLLHWVTAALCLTACALVEGGIVAWCASLVTSWELGIFLFSYALIAIGLLVTVWQMRQISNRQPRHL